MDFCLVSRALTLFAIALVCLFKPSCEAAEIRLHRCSKLLAAFNQRFQSASEDQKSTTVDSLNNLNMIRARLFSSYDLSSAGSPVIASDRSSGWTKQQVAARLSGLLKQSRSQPDEPGRTLTVGTTLAGNDEIANEMDARASLGEYHSTISSDFQKKSGGWDIFYVHPATLALLSGIVASMHDSMSLGVIPYVWIMRALPEGVVRMLGLFNLRQPDEARLNDQIQELQPGEWRFQSFDEQISKDLARRLLKTGEFKSSDIQDYVNAKAHPKWTYKLTGQFPDQYIGAFAREFKGEMTWLSVDELLYYDAVKREPVLLTFLRLNDKRPVFESERSTNKSLTSSSAAVQAR